MDNSNNRIRNSNNEIGNYNNEKYSNHNKYIVALKRNEYWNGELFDSKAAALQAAKEQIKEWMPGDYSDVFGEEMSETRPAYIYIGLTQVPLPEISAGDILDHAREDADHDAFLEDVTEDQVEDLQKELQKVFDRWIDGNDLRYCFSICNIEKVEVSSIGD